MEWEVYVPQRNLPKVTYIFSGTSNKGQVVPLPYSDIALVTSERGQPSQNTSQHHEHNTSTVVARPLR